MHAYIHLEMLPHVHVDRAGWARCSAGLPPHLVGSFLDVYSTPTAIHSISASKSEPKCYVENERCNQIYRLRLLFLVFILIITLPDTSFPLKRRQASLSFHPSLSLRSRGHAFGQELVPRPDPPPPPSPCCLSFDLRREGGVYSIDATRLSFSSCIDLYGERVRVSLLHAEPRSTSEENAKEQHRHRHTHRGIYEDSACVWIYRATVTTMQTHRHT